MGGNGSTQRGQREKGGPSGDKPCAGEDAPMEDPMESLDSMAESLKVKDPDAWKGTHSPRPRSALKHVNSTTSHDSEASGSTMERTPSGRRMPRKVSFQVHGLAPPPEIADGGEGAEKGPHQAHKRVKNSEEFSMKYLVDYFYSKVLKLPELRQFFDGVDMRKLKYQQEALMLLVFGGQELLDDELPGLSADLRLIHLHLLFEGLNLSHWKLFADTFSHTLDELHQIPEDVRTHAKSYMATTQHFFRPIEAHEWPPKVVYKGWTKRSCPFHTSFKSIASVYSEEDEQPADGAAAANPKGSYGEEEEEEEDDDAFVLPGFKTPQMSMSAPVAAAFQQAADLAAEAEAAAEAAAAAPLSSEAGVTVMAASESEAQAGSEAVAAEAGETVLKAET